MISQNSVYYMRLKLSLLRALVSKTRMCTRLIIHSTSEDMLFLPAGRVRMLLRKMDEQLFNHFEAHEMGDMLFVHR